MHFLLTIKCSFAQHSIGYLGHTTICGAQADFQNEFYYGTANTTTVIQLCGLFGLTGYYRKLVEYYARIAYPLTELRKRYAFIWFEEAQHSFEALRQAMRTAPVLTLPDFSKLFYYANDTSGVGVGAVLL